MLHLIAQVRIDSTFLEVPAISAGAQTSRGRDENEQE